MTHCQAKGQACHRRTQDSFPRVAVITLRRAVPCCSSPGRFLFLSDSGFARLFHLDPTRQFCLLSLKGALKFRAVSSCKSVECLGPWFWFSAWRRACKPIVLSKKKVSFEEKHVECFMCRFIVNKLLCVESAT